MNVLSFKTSTLPGDQDKALRSWLTKREADTLRDIIRAKAKRYLVEAGNAAAEVAPGNALDDKVLAASRDARRYLTFLDVLQEIVDQREAFSVIVIQ